MERRKKKRWISSSWIKTVVTWNRWTLFSIKWIDVVKYETMFASQNEREEKSHVVRNQFIGSWKSLSSIAEIIVKCCYVSSLRLLLSLLLCGSLVATMYGIFPLLCVFLSFSLSQLASFFLFTQFLSLFSFTLKFQSFCLCFSAGLTLSFTLLRRINFEIDKEKNNDMSRLIVITHSDSLRLAFA